MLEGVPQRLPPRIRQRGDAHSLSPWGLWERWRNRAAGDVLQSFTIVTTVPNELCAAIHDRMPAVLPREKWATWRARGGCGQIALDDPAAVSRRADARLSRWHARRQRAE